MITPAAHRPWPLPRRRWHLFMRWLDLAFLHWPVDAAAVNRLLPRGLSVDTYNGAAWLGVVPFAMSGTRLRLLPPIPGVSAFPELNVRTYVTIDGKPGVWFFSLDAGSALAVRAARLGFSLPYFDARMSIRREGEAVHYRSRRTHRGAASADFDASYRPTGEVFRAEPETLEYFLVERYCLYVERRGRICRGEIHHPPWPLHPGEAVIRENTMAQWLGIELPPMPPLVHFAERIDVVAWYLH